MTRQQIRSNVQDLIGETLGSAGSLSPFLLDTWINQAADELAMASDCWWAKLTMDVTAGQSLYCGADASQGGTTSYVYKIRSVQWLDGAGNWNKLQEVT